MPKRRGIMDYRTEDYRRQLPNNAFAAIMDERIRQNAKWGEQNHNQLTWLAILAEEFGEAAKEINELHFRGHMSPLGTPQARLRTELIQTAAVAVAMIESLDRNGR